MSNTPLSRSFEKLPVYGPEHTICFNKLQIRQIAQKGVASFVRMVRPFEATDGTTPFGAFLRTADQQLQHVAKITGSTVIPHIWGRHELTPDEFCSFNYAYSSETWPPNWVLVAEVPVLKDVLPLPYRITQRVNRRLDQYRETQIETRQACLYDMNASQIVVGTLDDVRSHWLVDIEPGVENMSTINEKL